MPIHKATEGTDYAQRQSVNSMFGDKWTSHRVPDVLVNFVYGVNDHFTDSSVSGTGAISATGGVCTLTSGSGVGKATIESQHILRYRPGFDGYLYFTGAFSLAEANVTQRLGMFDDNDGYWIGCVDGVQKAGIRKGGSDFLIDIDVTKHGFTVANLNIYRITYGWLGVAPVVFELYTGLTSGWVTLATYFIGGAQEVPSTEQPSHRIRMEVERTSGSGEMTIKTCSWSAGSAGASAAILPSDTGHGAVASHATVSTEQNLLAITNVNTFNGVLNKVVGILELLSAATDGTKNVELKVYKNPTLTGSGTFTAVDSAHSPMLSFVSSSAISGGEQIFPVSMAKVDSLLLDLYKFDIEVYPGDLYVISGESAGNNDIDISLRWKEGF